MKRAISVVMPVYNAEKYIVEAIESVLKQSFTNFELIIVDDGSTDRTLSIIGSFADERIVLLQNDHDFIASLNLGIDQSTGKYIARMDADDIMYTDRLKIQYEIMEAEPNITVCGTWVAAFGEHIPKEQNIAQSYVGIIHNPLVDFLKGNFVYHSTVMIRKAFLEQYHLRYEPYMYAEDYKLWTEIAKHEGVFYIESLPLLFYRISEDQVSKRKNTEQKKTTSRIKQEILSVLLKRCSEKNVPVEPVYLSLLPLIQAGVLTEELAIQILQGIIRRIIN